MKKYHKETGIPEEVRKEAQFVGRLKYSAHAKKAAKTDKYGRLPVLTTLDSSEAELIEVEFNKSGSIEKNLFRLPFTEELDLVLAVVPTGIVKTVWANRRVDRHLSLRTDQYCRV